MASIGHSFTSKEAAAVRLLLARILESDAFRGSERSKQFLSFVVERTLEGRQAEIKERTIGIDVFGRPADYEPTADSIVRVKANEVRRRLTQFHSASPGEPVRIELPAGSYVPVISWGTEPAAEAQPAARGLRGWLWFALGAAAALCVVGTVLLLRTATPAGPMDRFWEPVVLAKEAPILRLPESQAYLVTKHGGEVLDAVQPGANSVALDPADFRKVLGFQVSTPTFHATMDIALHLQRRGTTPLLRVGADLPAADLRSHPVIAISSRPSEWAMSQASGMRFRFRAIEGATKDAYMIEDGTRPDTGWHTDATFPFAAQGADYALVSRVFDPSTRNVAISVSGLTSFGSQAAAAFITNPDGWEQIVAKAPAGWERKNLQVVLHTTLVGRTPSPAKVVAVHCW